MSGVVEPTLTMELGDGLRDGQILLVLVGLIAAGKSTFASALEFHAPFIRRCNQDDMGSRQAVEKLARQSLRQGLSVCIDRTNFNETQRAHWVTIAREVPGTAVWCLFLDTPLNVCADRLRTRTGHPTIKSSEQGLSVLHRFASDFRAPSPHEGFDRILIMKPSDHPSTVYTRDDIILILNRIRDSPPAAYRDNSDATMKIPQFFRRSPRGVSGRHWRQRHLSTMKSDRGGGVHSLAKRVPHMGGDLDRGGLSNFEEHCHELCHENLGHDTADLKSDGSLRDEGKDMAGPSTTRSQGKAVSGDGSIYDPFILS